MKTPREFWPLLHFACSRFEAGGSTHQERIDSAIDAFARLSVSARSDMLRELHCVLSALNELEPLALIQALTDKAGDGAGSDVSWRSR